MCIQFSESGIDEQLISQASCRSGDDHRGSPRIAMAESMLAVKGFVEIDAVSISGEDFDYPSQ